VSVDATKMTAFLRSNQLSTDTRLYRYSDPKHLVPTTGPGVVEISANADPSEAVVDVYGGGNVTLALHVGAGLAFAESADNSWRADGRTCIELRLGDVLDQGGAIYPVESVIVERVWYVTLPAGKVRVRTT